MIGKCIKILTTKHLLIVGGNKNNLNKTRTNNPIG